MNNKKGLGRGLDALLSIFDDEADTTQNTQEAIKETPKIEPVKHVAPTAPIEEEMPPVDNELEMIEKHVEEIKRATAEEKIMRTPKDEFTDDMPPFVEPTAEEREAFMQQPTPSEKPFLFDTDELEGFAPHTSFSSSHIETPTKTIDTFSAKTVTAEYGVPKIQLGSKPKDEGVTLGISELPIEYLEVNPNQPRKNFDQIALTELAESIKIHGIIQPIVVNKISDTKYMIIAGERRYRASKLVGLKVVPCVIKQYTERQIKEVSLIENLQREDLNPIEAARAIRQLMEEYNFTQDIVADRIGKSRPSVTNILRLLNLTPEVIKMVETGVLSAGQARPMITILDRNLQVKVAQTVVEKKLSVRESEKLVREVMRPQKPDDKRNPQSAELVDFGEQLQRVFSTKVSILGNDDKGRICIDYFSKDDLDRIFELMELLKSKKLTLQDLSNFNKRP